MTLPNLHLNLRHVLYDGLLLSFLRGQAGRAGDFVCGFVSYPFAFARVSCQVPMGIIHKFFDAPERGWLGPKAPRPPTPGLNLPPGAWIPDHKIYKLENAPELELIEKRLAARGLKSPWLRNEVWRYNRKLWGSEAWRRFDFIAFGWKYALPMLIVTAFYEAYVKKADHGHVGQGHNDGGHH